MSLTEQVTDEDIGIVEAAAVRQLKAQLAPRWSWKAYAFEIKRKSDRVGRGKIVRPRTVTVYSPLQDAAALGVGVAADEVFRPIGVPLSERLTASMKPSKRDMADFFEALGSAIKAGQSMREAMECAARVIRSPRMRGIIGTLSYLVSKGFDAHIAFSLFPDQFGPMVVALVAAAHKAGSDEASKMYLKLAVRLQKDGKTMRQFMAALAYPVFIIFMTGIGTLILAMKSLPVIAELFLSMGAKLPGVTQAYYDVAKVLLAYWWAIFPGLFAVIVFTVAAVPALLRKHWVQRSVVRMPFFGTIMMSMAIARGFSTFVLLRTNGAKPKDCFALSGAASGNIVIAEFFDAAYRRVAGGEDLASAITAERDALGEDGTRIAGKIELASKGGDLDVLMDNVVDELNERAETRIAFLPKALNLPLMIICVAMIGSIALAISLPFPNLIATAAEGMSAKH